MSLQTQIEISEQGGDQIKQLEHKLQGRNANGVIGRAAVNRFRQHFFDRNNSKPNKLGGRRTNYFAQAARSTHFQQRGSHVEVATNQVGINLRRYGGTVRPKRVKFLTIPQHEDAYGKRAREFNDLRFEIVAGVGPALVRAEQVKLRRRKNKKTGASRLVPDRDKQGRVITVGGEVFFALRRQTTHAPDATVFPTEAELLADIETAVDEYLEVDS